MFIQTEATANPARIRFLPGRAVLPSGTAQFAAAEGADGSPLARALFELDGVSGVALDPTSITLAKADGMEWAELMPAALVAIMDHFGSGRPVIDDGFETSPESGLDSDDGKAIQRLLDEHINPQVASHGGHIALVDVKGDTAYIRMGGGCQGCGMANVTLKQGVAKAIQAQIPAITNVLDVTDHGGGANPYYQPGKGGASAL
ncbi:MAG: NifU family protein [Proteobacteria bacterium]|nr:NifU family protein [Pseudomonadota bacterium]